MVTLRQKKRAKILGKNRTVEEELLEAGYAPSTARKQPPSVTKGKGFLELANEKLPDEKLFAIHDEALGATKVVSAVKTSRDAGADSTDFIDVPDYPTRLRAVELGYKVKGHLRDNVLAQQFNVGGEMSIEFIGDESKT